MGVCFDKIYYESQTYLKGKAKVEEGLAKGLFERHEDNSVRADLTNEGLDQKLLLRSDGTSVYMTQVIGIDNGTLAALHLTIWQLHHTIGEMYQFLPPLES